MARRQRTLMEHAHQRIREQVMSMELQPGAGIDDLRLSEELGLSRTPVREALFSLASEGLVIVRPGGGFTVRSLDLTDISRLFEAHIVLAKAVARLVALRADDDDLARLAEAETAVVDAVATRDPVAISAANATLHRLEATVARNEYLERLAGQIHDQGQRLGFLSFGGVAERSGIGAHLELVCRDHAAILAAYRARDADAAESVSTRHVELFRDRIVRFLTASGADDVDLSGDWVRG